MRTIKFSRLVAGRKILRAYTGEEYGWRKGKYWDPGTPGFKRALARLEKADPEVAVFDEHDDWRKNADEELKWRLEIENTTEEPLLPVGVSWAVKLAGSLFVDMVSGKNRAVAVFLQDPVEG